MISSQSISIDEVACIRCGICATICPNGVFTFDNQNLVMKNQGRCIRCGHCEAVCETGALKHEGIRRESLPIDTETAFSSEQLQHLFDRRRSCRSFLTKTVLESDFSALLNAAASSPTATNAQNVRFVYLDEPRQIALLEHRAADYYLRLVERLTNPFLRFLYRLTVGKRIVDAYRYHLPTIEERFRAVRDNEASLFYHAPLVLIGVASGLPHMACANINLAVMQMMLKAETLGLGTLYNGYALTALARDKTLRQKLGIQAGYTPGAVLAVGYPAVRFYRSPQRRTPRVIRVAND